MLRRIILAVDGSEPSRRASEFAGRLALDTHSEVVVLHVRETEVTYAGAFPLETPDAAEEFVDTEVRRLKNQGVSARGEVVPALYGRASRVILEIADTEGADMVVMGSRGRSDLAGLVLGSVTHKVIHLAHCPVLLVR